MIDALSAMVDTLSTTLMKMKLKITVSGAIEAGGNWAFEFPASEGFKLYVLLRGDCWIWVEGDAAKHIQTGDCILVTTGKSFVVAKELSIKKRVSAQVLFANAQNGVMTWNGGGDFMAIGTYFEFDGPLPKIVFGQLPAVIHIPGHLEQAAILRLYLERFSAEFRGNNAGRSLILNHLTPIMLVQVMRIYLTDAKSEKNWLVALSDPKLSKTIEALHANYQRSWSLDELAKIAGMSRSGFALNFKKQIGISPMDYLTNWRIQIACELLQSGDHSMSEVANAVGYESESAFSAAFKRILKCRPGFYQKSYQNPSTNLNQFTPISQGLAAS